MPNLRNPGLRFCLSKLILYPFAFILSDLLHPFALILSRTYPLSFCPYPFKGHDHEPRTRGIPSLFTPYASRRKNACQIRPISLECLKFYSLQLSWARRDHFPVSSFILLPLSFRRGSYRRWVDPEHDHVSRTRQFSGSRSRWFSLRFKL